MASVDHDQGHSRKPSMASSTSLAQQTPSRLLKRASSPLRDNAYGLRTPQGQFVLQDDAASGFSTVNSRRQRRRLFPPEPDLTVVDFRIPRQPSGRPRMGNLAAFLPDPVSLTHPRHFHFSFSIFTEYMTNIAGFPEATQWTVRFPDGEKRFDDRASWLHALQSISRFLDAGNEESLTVEFLPDVGEEAGTVGNPMLIKEESSALDPNPLHRPSISSSPGPALQSGQVIIAVQEDETTIEDETPMDAMRNTNESNSTSDKATARRIDGMALDRTDLSSPLSPPPPPSNINDDMSIYQDAIAPVNHPPPLAEATIETTSAECLGAQMQGTEEPVSKPSPDDQPSQAPSNIPLDAQSNEVEDPTNRQPITLNGTSSEIQPATHENTQAEVQVTSIPALLTPPPVSPRPVPAAEDTQSPTKQHPPVSQTVTLDASSPTNAQEQPLVSLGIDVDEAEQAQEREYTDAEDVEDEPFGNERIAPTQQLLFNQNFLTEEQWIEVCTVLDHPVEQRDGRKLLPGTHQSLLIHQMAFIVRAMKCHRTRQELSGLLLADNVGIGKSLCALGLFAATSLVLLNVRHVARNPGMHIPAGTVGHPGLSCPSGNPYGIQCVCVPDSIPSDYAQQLVCGPSVLTVPASNLDAWARRITNYFQRHVKAKGSTEDEQMIDPVCYRESGQLSPIAVDGRVSMIDKDDIIAKPMASTDMLPSLNDYFSADRSRGGHSRGRQEPMSYEAMNKEYGDTVRIRFEPPRIDDLQFRFLILVSFSAYGSPKSSLSKIFGVRIPFKRSTSKASKRHKPSSSKYGHKVVPVQIPFAVAVNLFIFDESHSVTGHDTRLYSNFRDAQRLSTVNRHRRTKWFFMTATPFSHSPNDICACLELLVSNTEERQRLLEELPVFASRFRRLQSAAAASKTTGKRTPSRQGVTDDTADSTTCFARDFANFVRPFTVARDWGSPYLDTILHDVRPGITRHTVRVSVPQSLQGVVERLGARCRRELIRPGGRGYDNLQLKDLEEVTIFTQYFSAGIMPGIAAMIESFDEANSSPDPLFPQSDPKSAITVVPASVKQVDEDFRLGKRSVMRKTLGFHRGHEWTLRLREIIDIAHNDRTSLEGEDSSGPRHILLVAQTPALVGYITHFLQNDSHLKEITEAVRIFQTVTPKPAGRDTFLREIAAAAAKSAKSYVIVTTPRLVGVGIDIVFCSYLIQFGEIFSNRDREQLIGRVNRPGQRLPVHHWHIMSTHQSHRDVRNRNNGRSVMLSEHAGREEAERVQNEEEDVEEEEEQGEEDSF